MAMAERKNIEFGVEGGVTLRGWLFVPGAKGPAPATAWNDLHRLSRKPVLSCWSMIIAISGQAMGQSAGMSTLGSRSPIGGARFHFLRAGPKLMPLRSASGAPAMPGATRLCSVLPTGD